jgi:hypothetical protein
MTIRGATDAEADVRWRDWVARLCITDFAPAGNLARIIRATSFSFSTACRAGSAATGPGGAA